ncbi:MAG: ABC transporter ATP-binding protein [Corallococcus sp.]|nr:ABC transporter ATP-binding protein [Corallococcus sp.]
MKNPDNVLEIEDLQTYFYTDNGTVKSVNGISFEVPKDSIVGLVGESGCGKSVTSLSIMQLVQAPQGQVVGGSIRFRAKTYVLDEKGKRIPVYETETVDGEERVKLQVKRDKKGNIVYDKKPQPVLDKDGNQIYDADGKPAIDKRGNPVMVPVTKKDEHGYTMYETQDKTFDIAKMPTEDMCKIRGKEISMIFQEPMTSLNPVFTVGYQIEEVVYLIDPEISKANARKKAIEMLTLVGIPMPETVVDYYPHQLSGGMRQRVMIAIALTGNPRLIIADEPTTALDVTIQSQILQLIKKVQKSCGASVVLITHDLGVVAETADYVVVMYAGKIVEKGTVYDIFDNPLHPYTMGIQKAKPTLDSHAGTELYSIPGNVPNPINMPNECLFKDRCDRRCEKCGGEYPAEIKVSETHSVFCHLYDNLK